jgi:hypothetical protein
MIGAAILLALASADQVAGTWEGVSLCQVKPSPCQDEQVIYRITALQPRYRISGYKIVAGSEVFMGLIDVTLDAGGSQLDGAVTGGGRLHLGVNGRHLSGTLTLADGTLYRRIAVDKH